MSDRSVVGVYLASAPAPELRALALAPDRSVVSVPGGRGEQNAVPGLGHATVQSAGSGLTREKVDAASGSGQNGTGTLSYALTVQQNLRALAIYPDAALTNARVEVTADRPDGSREELITFRPMAGWARRYWFAEPVFLPRGTTVTVTADLNDNALLPPGALPPAGPLDPSAVRLTLNVVPGD
jgi:hypothetical protein